MAKSEITVEGFVARNPEARAAGSHTVTTVVVPEEQGRMKDGQWVADTDKDGNKIVVWWEAEFWNEHGDVVAANVSKGDLVVVRGNPRPQAYVKKDGAAGLRPVIANATVAKVVRRPARGQGGGFGGGSAQGQGDWAQPPANAPQNADFGGGFADEESQPF